MLELDEILQLMAQLRDPDTGCPWDLAQTFESIVPHTLEEAYEVAAAIESKNMAELPLELGDLLFQVVFYCQLAKEQHQFDFKDVLVGLKQKLIERHPHVFAQQPQPDWEQNKTQQRQQQGLASLMDDLPLTLASLSRAQKVQKRAASVGFDWGELAPILAKVHEEIAEVLEEANRPMVNKQALQLELGDLLFSVVNLARHLGVDAEQALRLSTHKFASRFRQVEMQVQKSGRLFSQHTLQELDCYWIEAKKHS
ncbi:nucleoside triphosphate pyrophosphohydrolase [Paraferrimonas sp. SM1919]|uniref:nucleoside triphosphate pyrophosphohydrolase n=1 Tax=Paraferrimonas sp. SM1919 TaxID=2662263 RepID=UPI0013D46B52|nr:nucleoside triphosphate pyrophosphohydrolase [Paraferrimonas sp. SM1919]